MISGTDKPPYIFPFTPVPENNWRIDWNGLCAAFDAVRRLADCPQDPLYHAEGDVLIHTRMVCESLASLPEWRLLSVQARSIVFAATLLHDVAKPLCTKEENGRITSRGHSRKGALLARCLLWNIWPDESSRAFFEMREAVVGLVRYHGLPLYFMERPEPLRAVIEASLISRLDWLALVAEVDVRGRICRDRHELADRVALFREFAAEHGCLARPYPFASDHSRFLYFRRPDLPPTHELFDDSRCEVILMSGLPASGKDAWIGRNCAGRPVISLDDIRGELEITPDEAQGTVAQEARSRVKSHLRNDEPIVWNATNTTRMTRASLIDLFVDYRARVRIVYVETSFSDQSRRNRRRAQPVPEGVVTRLRQRLEIPDATEAWRVEIVTT